jgi:hypothetical protein
MEPVVKKRTSSKGVHQVPKNSAGIDKSKISKEQMVMAAWQRGMLAYKLDQHQLPLYKAIWNAIENKYDTYTINCSRQFGKSFLLLLVAIEFCLRNRGAQVRFAIPIASNYEEMYGLSLSTILDDVPSSYKPEHQTSKKAIFLKNGSHIKFAGTDGTNYQNLRGSLSHLNIIDEAAFCDNLKETFEHVLKPQTTRTGGLTVFCSTPPTTQDHYYIQQYFKDKARDRVQQFTIYQNSALTPERIAQIAADAGGIDSSTFRREYLCEFVVDEETVIIKEWDKVKDKCIRKPDTSIYQDKFGYVHKYEGMDLGVEDLTICLFGYYDFLESTLYIQDELKMNGPTLVTPDLAKGIKDKEKELWGGLNPPSSNPYRRIADSNNKQLLNDLQIVYDLSFIPVRKTKAGPDQPSDSKQSILNGMINKLRVMIGEGRVVVDPKCTQLLGCLQYASWNKTRTEFARNAMFGHYDALAALIYMVKMLDCYTNPFPTLMGVKKSTHYIPVNQPKEESKVASEIRTIFKPTRFR